MNPLVFSKLSDEICPFPGCPSHALSPGSGLPVRNGSFYRKSTRSRVRRFICPPCGRGFSLATLEPSYRQKRRDLNQPVRELLCSGVSLTRAAELLRVNPKTVVRKAIFLGTQAKLAEKCRLSELADGEVEAAQFDEMQTSEHTKCKPISIPLLVHPKARQILGIGVASMPATGKLAEIARRKYPPRRDERAEKGQAVLSCLERIASQKVPILTDQWPAYPHWIRATLPEAEHSTVKGRRGCVVGQGELKRGGFDPLFSLNHTAAMLRANVNRLHRRTWCTTKRMDRLELHLWLYVNFHNETRIEEIRALSDTERSLGLQVA